MHATASCKMSMPRWWFNSFISSALSTASSAGVMMEYKGFKGLMRTHVTIYLEGEAEAVTRFYNWLENVAIRNP